MTRSKVPLLGDLPPCPHCCPVPAKGQRGEGPEAILGSSGYMQMWEQLKLLIRKPKPAIKKETP